MTELDVALAAIGALVLALAITSGLVRQTILSEPIVATLLGVLLGPAVLGLLDLGRHEGVVLEQGARITLAIALMAIALRLALGEPFRQWRAAAVFIGFVMPLMWATSGLLAYLVFGLPFWLAMLAGAVVTPTDPILATSVVTGRVADENLPTRVRKTLLAESGANDGLAYPLVFLPILVLAPGEEALLVWVTQTLLWQVVGAALLGGLLGVLAGSLLRWARESAVIETTYFSAYSLALSLVVLGTSKLAGTDGILAVFVASVAFAASLSERERGGEEVVQEAVSRLFVLPIFVLFGLALPWERWVEFGWRGLVLVAAVLLLRRLPHVLALAPRFSRLPRLPDALFLGWFGPIGVSAIFYAHLAVRETGVEEIWTIASLVVFASILAHGVTATPFTRRFATAGGRSDEAR